MSKFYNQLVSCEKKLRKNLITQRVLSSPMSLKSQYNLLSYRVLSHAEIEYYIENIILHRVNIEKNRWNTNKVISNCVANLIAYSGINFDFGLSQLTDVTTKNDINFRVHKVFSHFEASLKANHGIKEANVIPLLVPIGVTQISQTLLNNLSSFGKSRGDTAHNSTKTQQPINPNDEISKVSQIVIELKDIDDLIVKMK